MNCYDWIYQTFPRPDALRSNSQLDFSLTTHFQPEKDLKVFFSCIALLCFTGLAFRLFLKREDGDWRREGELESSSGIFIPSTVFDALQFWEIRILQTDNSKLIYISPRVVMLASLSFLVEKLLSISEERNIFKHIGTKTLVTDKFTGKSNHIPESDVDTFLSAAERRLETGGREGSHLTPVFNRLRSQKLSEIIGPQSTKDQCLLLTKISSRQNIW